jgi:hypothetical protein
MTGDKKNHKYTKAEREEACRPETDFLLGSSRKLP